MRILINDLPEIKERYYRLYREAGYDDEELIFFNGYEEIADFIRNQIVGQKNHVDLIITGEDAENGRAGILQGDRLLQLIQSITDSYSNNNFRTCSIPVILYSTRELHGNLSSKYSAVVLRNDEGFRDNLVEKMEQVVRKWRENILEDLEFIKLELGDLSAFQSSNKFKEYQIIIIPAIYQIFQQTKILSHYCPTKIEKKIG